MATADTPEERKSQIRKECDDDDEQELLEPKPEPDNNDDENEDYKPVAAVETDHLRKRLKTENKPETLDTSELSLRLEERTLSMVKVRDVLCKLLRIFNVDEWITAPQIALRMREASISLQDVKDCVGDNKYTLSCFMLSYPDAFIQETIWDYRRLCLEINNGKIMAPAGKYPALPICRWSISQKAASSIEEYVYLCNRVPQPLSKICVLCRCEGNTWYGHHEGHCRRYKMSSSQLQARHTSGVSIPSSIVLARKAEKERLDQQRKAYEELKRHKEELLKLKKKNPWGVSLGGELPFNASDDVTAMDLDIPVSKFHFLIGKEGKNIQLLQETYGVLIKVPFKGSSNQKAYIKGRVDKVRDAKALLEEKYNDPEYDVFDDALTLPPQPQQPEHRRGSMRGKRM